MTKTTSNRPANLQSHFAQPVRARRSAAAPTLRTQEIHVENDQIRERSPDI